MSVVRYQNWSDKLQSEIKEAEIYGILPERTKRLLSRSESSLFESWVLLQDSENKTW